MKLTPEQQERLKLNAAAMIAFAEGKPIQYRNPRSTFPEWYDIDESYFDCSSHEYRPKPEPKVRPWSKQEDVPLGIVYIRRAGFIHGFSILLSAGTRGIQIPNSDEENEVIEWAEIKDYEHSTDRREWLKCEVPE